MPSTSNFGFDYESPTSLPGTTLTGGMSGSTPILAVQVDAALTSVNATVQGHTASINTNTATGVANATNVTNLTNWTRVGTQLLTFVTLDNYSAPTTNFGFTFPGNPVVRTNINTGVGATSRWHSRAISITPTGFVIFVFASTAGLTSSWTDIEVGWEATYRP